MNRSDTKSSVRAISHQLEAVIRQLEVHDPRYASALRARLGSAVAEARKVREAALEISETEADAADEERQILAAGISEILAAEYGRRERFLRKAEQLDSTAAEATSWFIKTYEEMSLAFLRRQFDAIRADLRSNHSWYTGIQDSTNQAAKAAKQMTTQAGKWFSDVASQIKPDLSWNVDDPPADETATLLERTFEKHLGEKAREQFNESLRKDLDRDLALRWKQAVETVAKEVAHDFEQLSLREDGLGQVRLGFQMDDSVKIGLFGLAATATSTVVLAAGWHTLAWSMTGLFLPLLPVVILASLGTALINQKRSLEMLLNTVKDQQLQLESSLKDAARYKLHRTISQSNQTTAETYRERIFQKVIGNFPSSLLNHLLRALEDQLDLLGSGIDRDVNGKGDNRSGPWLERAQKTLAEEDEVTAAMYASLAFEQILRDINRRRGLQFNFRVPHHNRAFLDRLACDDHLPPEAIRTLRRLKQRRDQFTHRMHHIITLPQTRRRKMASEMIESIVEMRSALLARN